ncbi:protein WVD2-like 6 isoform X1 [Citrus sinensis]|nr:protein WVD2-like 6 isoform X1 [Citrus sinensis]XP_052297013.1 protein WVD2-like 6 isoform X1 [Citrus sinensis]XP_052297016.1 protein WVD2-like 6 isoform X1 [Citrus sinensis]
MEATNLIIGDEIDPQNEAYNSGQDELMMEKLNKAYNIVTQNEGPNDSTKTVELATESTIADSSSDKDGEVSTLQEEFIGLTLHKESGVEKRKNADNSKKGPVREVNERGSRPKSVAALAKKNKDGKIGSVTSKQPLAIATNRRLSNDTLISGSTTGLDSGRPARIVSAPRPAHLSQVQTRMSLTSSPATDTKDSIGLRQGCYASRSLEKARHQKHLKQGPPEVKEGTHSSSSPEGDTKPQRTGVLPAYGFSFKCDERAQKRKEFYAKLEEKIHAREVEKTTIQAKTQENQEAEIKMFRKSLMFKATPMPSFYHEPAPPKVELKKTPPTRAKSPKLSRSRSSRIKDSDGNSSHSSQSGRFSLDVKLTQNRVAKGSSPQDYKKPLRKSLPKLPSEKTTLANTTVDSASISQLSEQPDLEPEAECISEPSGSQGGINSEPVAEELEQATLEEPETEATASKVST